MQKKILAAILSLFLVFQIGVPQVQAASLQSSVTQQAEEADSLNTGLKPLQVIEIEEDDLELDQSSPEEEIQTANSYDWSSYSNDYCYNRMNDSERSLYSGLDTVCKQMAATTKSATATQYGYCLDAVAYSGLTSNEVYDVVWLYIYQNPQYYFLSEQILRSYYASDSTSGKIYLCVYDNFADGNNRATVTEQFMTQINTWESQVKAQSTEYDKAKKAHDIVCANVGYASGTYDQSAYSAVLGERKTVCAGYTKLYEILCNGAGIEALGVVSESHAWNQVKIGNGWYNVDTTWDDQGTIIYNYFLKSDNTMNADNDSHVLESYQNGRIAECLGDYDSRVTLTGISLNKTSMTLTGSSSQDKLAVTYTPANSTERPGLTWTSSNTGIATVDYNGNVSAVAPGTAAITVKAGSFSATCNVTVKTALFTVTFDNNGRGATTPSAQKVEWGKTASDPGSLSQKGYVFGGWYTDRACSDGQKWNFSSDKVSSNMTLYAKWVPEGTYHAAYDNRTFYIDNSGNMRCYDSNGNMVINQFVCDGVYTYYMQADGTAMTDRLTYHPDGEHIIYFDSYGHEVFDNFVNVKKSIAGDAVDDICYFNTFGYMYVDQTTFTSATGTEQAYYLNAYGVMQTGGWFLFANNVDVGYANWDGTLIHSTFSYDQQGRLVYFQADGRIAKGLICDGIYYYQMDETDGHLIGMFPVN